MLITPIKNILKNKKKISVYLHIYVCLRLYVQILVKPHFLQNIETDLFIEITHKLKPKVGAGPDEIFCKLLKETIQYFKHPLTRIINI